MVGVGHGMFYRLGLSGLGQAAELVLPLQPGGATQRLEHAVAGRVLCGVVRQKQDTTCPQLSKLGGTGFAGASPSRVSLGSFSPFTGP